MSKELFEARKKLSSVSSLAKQGKLTNAVQCFHRGLQIMLAESLLKSEKSEFARFIEAGVREINNNKQMREQFQISLSYAPGHESLLLDSVRALLEAMEQSALSEAEQAFKARETQKKADLERLAGELAAKNMESARSLAESMAADYSDDAGLLVDISEAFEHAGLNDEAIIYMEKARKLDPDAAYILNKLGILHRRGKNMEEAEKMFTAAERHTPDDPYIHFNKGRLYVDWQKWKQAETSACAALALFPEFGEAKKMAAYIAKRV
ncbi:MAG: tetratricopeptide repeat protein [Deltaproteobacteria bacterium]|jgi:tetratricopeptide (TPR) repeat protein|nr:tetratricopeptide repeat protein [Deltaproteobacteria bacterium]